MDIEKKLFPEHGKLTVKDGVVSVLLSDMELDPLECTFDNGGCIEINTDDYSYITLSSHDLYRMAELIDEAENIYKEMFKEKECNTKK